MSENIGEFIYGQSAEIPLTKRSQQITRVALRKHVSSPRQREVKKESECGEREQKIFFHRFEKYGNENLKGEVRTNCIVFFLFKIEVHKEVWFSLKSNIRKDTVYLKMYIKMFKPSF